MSPGTMPRRCWPTARTGNLPASIAYSSGRSAIADRIDVLPLSPARQCATSYNFGMRAPFAQRDARPHAGAVDQRRHNADLLVDVLARATAARGPVGVQRFDFVADD